jgi:hypothetical protein
MTLNSTIKSRENPSLQSVGNVVGNSCSVGDTISAIPVLMQWSEDINGKNKFIFFSTKINSFFSILRMITTTTEEINFLAQMTPEETAEYEGFFNLLDATEYEGTHDFLIAEYRQ